MIENLPVGYQFLEQARKLISTAAERDERAKLAAEYVRRLRSVHRYERAILEFNRYRQLIFEFVQSCDCAAGPVAAYLQCLRRLGYAKKLKQLFRSLPHAYLCNPTVLAALQEGLVEIEPRASLCLAHNTLAHAAVGAGRVKARQLTRLAYVTAATGANGAEVERAVSAWKRTVRVRTARGRKGGHAGRDGGSGGNGHSKDGKGARGRKGFMIGGRSGYLDAAVHSLGGSAVGVLRGLNQELGRDGLVPLARAHERKELSPDNVKPAKRPPESAGGPLVSVLMPAYNASRYIGTAIASVLA